MIDSFRSGFEVGGKVSKLRFPFSAFRPVRAKPNPHRPAYAVPGISRPMRRRDNAPRDKKR
jgi:hypothetical protein